MLNEHGSSKKSKSGGFQSMGLSAALLKAIKYLGYNQPSPIQRKTIPLLLQGAKDVVAMARTGSGKSAAFLIPMVEKLKSHSNIVGVRGIVISPSRELALQTLTFVNKFCKGTDLRALALVGGENMENQFKSLAGNPDIIVATPGRLLHIIVEVGLSLNLVEFVVFDEADRLFEQGFDKELTEILYRLPPSEARQTSLFSATLPKLLIDFAAAGLRTDPYLIRLDTESKIPPDLDLSFFSVRSGDKDAALLYLLRKHIFDPQKKQAKIPKVIVFVSTKHHVEYITELLQESKYKVAQIYGSLDQSVRRINLARFRDGLVDILVVTDVAARGIDIPILDYVVNYDFPTQPKVFLHRVGRAGRAGRRGWAWSLVTVDEMPFVVDLQIFLSRPLSFPGAKLESDEPDLPIGGIPSNVLETDLEFVQALVCPNNGKLASIKQTAERALKQYLKCRPVASSAAHKRAKELFLSHPLPHLPHELLQNDISAAEIDRSEQVAKISEFRPHETIFEVGLRGKRAAEDQASLLMKRRRITTEKSKEKHKRAKSEAEELTGSAIVQAPQVVKKPESKAANVDFRDKTFYIDYLPPDYEKEKGYSVRGTESLAQSARKVTLEIKGDDGGDMRGRGSAARKLTWDSKKKKFKKETLGADNKRLIKGESGVRLPATLKSDRYEKWQKKTKIKLLTTGQKEDSNAKIYMKQGAEYRRYQHHKTKQEAPKEITKSVQQITKARMLSEKRRQKNARKPKKYKK